MVPLACLNYVHARALLDRPGLPDLLPCLPWPAPSVGFLFLSLQVWNVGVRHYASSGSRAERMPSTPTKATGR